jgi:hypothetical protein
LAKLFMTSGCVRAQMWTRPVALYRFPCARPHTLVRKRVGPLAPAQVFMYYKPHPDDNEYAHPLDLCPVVDLNTRE